MQQLSLDEWPMGLEEDALQVALEPDEITRRTNLRFERGRDSLDEFDGAVVALDEGQSFAFQRHVHSPTRGTTVLLRQGSRDELRALINLVSLTKKDITWMAPHIETELASVLRDGQRGGRRIALALVTLGAAGAVRKLISGRAKRTRADRKNKLQA